MHSEKYFGKHACQHNENNNHGHFGRYLAQWPLRRSVSFKVDFLLVINTKNTSYLAPFPSYG